MSFDNGLSPADVAALSGNTEGAFGGGAYWIIILFLFIFCGWGNNGWGNNGNAGAADNYVLASDFATIQRQLSDGFNSIDNALDRQNSGICDLGYTQAQLINGVQISGMQSANAIQSQLASCCCDIREGIQGVNYNLATQANGITNAVNTGFCTTNYNNASNTRDIIDATNASTQAILSAIQANKVEDLQNRIAEQNQQISALQLAASQQAQNNYLVNQLAPKLPVAAYTVPNPFTGCGCGCYCNS